MKLLSGLRQGKIKKSKYKYLIPDRFLLRNGNTSAYNSLGRENFMGRDKK
jgi:hypothetical protein